MGCSFTLSGFKLSPARCPRDVEALSDLFKRHPKCGSPSLFEMCSNHNQPAGIGHQPSTESVWTHPTTRCLQCWREERTAGKCGFSLGHLHPKTLRRSDVLSKNYSQMHLWLTEPTWQGLMTGTFSVQSDVLFKHLHLLGLRLPSESSFAAMTGLIAYYQPGGAEKTGFQLHTMLETVKGFVEKPSEKNETGEATSSSFVDAAFLHEWITRKLEVVCFCSPSLRGPKDNWQWLRNFHWKDSIAEKQHGCG